MNKQPQKETQQNLNISDDVDLDKTQIGGQAGRDLNVNQHQGMVLNISIFDRLIIAPDRFSQKSVEVKQSLIRQEQCQRKALLKEVEYSWIEGVLENSLHNQVLIKLGLEKKSELIKRDSSNLVEHPETSRQLFPKNTEIIDVFGPMGTGRTLLILGEPGGGKTVALLKLAKSLIAQADKDPTLPIPVVFNLSSWVKKRASIVEWLTSELWDTYKVPREWGKKWIQKEELLLLLDGLDEVKAEFRDDCARNLNEFAQYHNMMQMVVCCRFKDYEALSERLKLRSAIYIQALTAEQIDCHLERAGNQLAALRILLQQNTELQKLAKTPLILDIMSLSYKDYSLEDLPSSTTLKEDHHHLFSTYVERMLKRRGKNYEYSDEKIKYWLSWLAKRMREKSQTHFLIERMQPTWLPTKKYQNLYYILVRITVTFFIGLLTGLYLSYFSTFDQNQFNSDLMVKLLLIGFYSGLASEFIFGIFMFLISNKRIEKILFGSIYTLIVAINLELFNWEYVDFFVSLSIVFGVIVSIIYSFIREEIKPVNELEFSVNRLKKSLFFGFIVSIPYLLVKSLLYDLLSYPYGFSYKIYDILLFTISGGIIGGFRIPQIDKIDKIDKRKRKKINSNQGIIRSAKHAFICYAIIAPVVAFICWMVDSPSNPSSLIIVSLKFGLLGWLVGRGGAGIVLIQHFFLRLILYCTKCIPWNYARFLDAVSERMFIQKIGGGYIFYHRMLMDYFSQMAD